MIPLKKSLMRLKILIIQMGLILNKFAATITTFTTLTLIAACAQDPIYIQRRLPLPPMPVLPPVKISIGMPLTLENARDITIRDVLRREYENALSTVIKSTWSKQDE